MFLPFMPVLKWIFVCCGQSLSRSLCSEEARFAAAALYVRLLKPRIPLLTNVGPKCVKSRIFYN
jgi:hypothetical protein